MEFGWDWQVGPVFSAPKSLVAPLQAMATAWEYGSETLYPVNYRIIELQDCRIVEL